MKDCTSNMRNNVIRKFYRERRKSIMNNYLENLNLEIKEYFKVLSPEFPKWLLDYINTPEMQRIGTIGMNCGTDYTKIFNNKYFYTRLEHSIAVALIIWNFTKSKKQTLAGLFHDIATPCFSHCIDYLHEDYLEQEHTETKTQEILKKSNQIMKLLNKDDIDLEEVCDYKIYPIADNPKPRLSADRLEYNFSSGITFTQIWKIEDIQKMYENLELMYNEDNIIEMGFKDISVAEKFLTGANILFKEFQGNKDKLVMQFYADIMKIMIKNNIIKESELYIYSEQEIVERICKCGIEEIEKIFIKFKNTDSICEGETRPTNNYCVSLNVKERYINPLVKGKRVTEKAKKAKEMIRELLEYKSPRYAWFPFEIRSI